MRLEAGKFFMLFFGIMLGITLGTLGRMIEPYVIGSYLGSTDAKLVLVGMLVGLAAAIYVVKFEP